MDVLNLHDKNWFYGSEVIKTQNDYLNASGDAFRSVKKLTGKYETEYKAMFPVDTGDTNTAAIQSAIASLKNELNKWKNTKCPKQRLIPGLLSVGLFNVKGSNCEHEKAGRIAAASNLIGAYNDAMNTLKQTARDEAKQKAEDAKQAEADKKTAADEARQKILDGIDGGSTKKDSGVTDYSGYNNTSNTTAGLMGGSTGKYVIMGVLGIGVIFGLVSMFRHGHQQQNKQ